MKRSEAVAIGAFIAKAAQAFDGAVEPDTAIAGRAVIPIWEQGIFVTGNLRRYAGQVMRCVQGHDSTQNPMWTPEVSSLWTPMHGQSAQTAMEYRAPTGAHDIYTAGEYAIYMGNVYRCVVDCAYDPATYPAGWEAV